MKNKILALSIVIILTTMFTTSILSAHADSGGWFSSWEVQDANTSAVLASSSGQSTAPLMPGAQIKVVFTVNVAASGSGTLMLQTTLDRLLQDKFWELQTQSYVLGSVFNSNSAQAKFNWAQGTFTMVLYARIPGTLSDKPQNISLVKITDSAGKPLDQIITVVVSATGNEYQTALSQAQQQLEAIQSNTAIEPGFAQLYSNIIQESQTEYASGNVDTAKNLLSTLNVDVPQKPVDMSFIYIPTIAVLALVAVVSSFLFMKTRGKVSYYQLVVEDQIRDLEGLTMRAAKIDRTMSSNLNSVKEKLKNLVGV